MIAPGTATRTAAVRTRLGRRAALAAATLGLVSLAATACATDSVRSNNFTEPLNEFQVTMTAVAQAGSGEALATAVTNARPEVEQNFKEMEAAVAFLPEELKPIAETCIVLSKSVTASVEAIAAAELDKSQKALDKAIAELQTNLTAFDTDCVAAYNTATGVEQ